VEFTLKKWFGPFFPPVGSIISFMDFNPKIPPTQIIITQFDRSAGKLDPLGVTGVTYESIRKVLEEVWGDPSTT